MPEQQRDLILLYLISFMDLIAVGIIFPIFGPYVRSLGYSHLIVGTMTSIYAAIQVISGPIIGSWSDTRGRKSVLIITLLASSISYMCLGFCSSLTTIFFFRFLIGLFKHTQTMTKAVIADLVGHDKSISSKVYGRSVAIGSMGFVIGPVIGGHLSENTQYGFTNICLTTSVLFLITIVFVIALPETKPKVSQNTVNKHNKYLGELKSSFVDLKKVQWKTHWLSFVLKYLYVLCMTTFFVNQAVILKERYQLSQKQIGYMISFVSILGVLTSLSMGWITKTFYPNDKNATKRTLHCFSIVTVCFLGFYTVENIYITLLLLLPFGVCNAMLRIVTMEILFDKCKESERGSLTGASDSMMSLGRFTAPLTAGLISDWTDERSVMLFAGFVSLLGCFFSFKLSSNDQKVKLK